MESLQRIGSRCVKLLPLRLRFFVQPLSWTVPPFSLDVEESVQVKVLNSSFSCLSRDHSHSPHDTKP